MPVSPATDEMGLTNGYYSACSAYSAAVRDSRRWARSARRAAGFRGLLSTVMSAALATSRTLRVRSAVMSTAGSGDLIYCDPPYSDSQSILYGAQTFSLDHLFVVIEACKRRGAMIALSIDGTKRSGRHSVALPIPKGLFEREILIDVGRSMLKRFQMNGKSLEEEEVSDRLLLTY